MQVLRHIIRPLILLLALLCATVGQAQVATQSQSTYEEAEKEFQIGHIDQAIQLLDQHLQSYKGTLLVSAYRLLALCHLAQDNQQEATRYVSLLLKENPYYSVSLNDSERFADMVRNQQSGKVILVTASQQAETLEEAPVPVTIITEEMIRAIHARDLRDVLCAYVPGMTPVEGEEANLSMRGINAYSQENILILLNGHRLNSRCTNSESPDYRINLEKLKQIEVLRGPASSLYGNVALTAVVNLITKEGRDVDGLEFGAGYGSGDAFKSYVLFGKRLVESDLFIWTGLYSANGYKHTIGKDSPYAYGLVPRDGYLYVDGYNRKPAYDFGFTYQWNKWKFMFNQQHSKRTFAYTNMYFVSTYDYHKYDDINGQLPGRSTETTRGDLQFNSHIGKVEVQASAFVDFERTNIYSMMGDSIPTDFAEIEFPLLEDETVTSPILATNGVFLHQSWQDITMGATAKFFYDYQSDRMHGNLLWGAQYEHFDLFYNDLTFGDQFGRTRLNLRNDRNLLFKNGIEQSFSLFTQWKHAPSPKWIWNIGLRYDFKSRYDSHKINVLSPRLSLIYLPNSRWNAKLSYARAFVDAPYFYRVSTTSYPGAENLNPQYFNSVQLSSSIDFIPKKLSYEANLFYNVATDVITLTAVGYDNAGTVKTLGLEQVLRYQQQDFNLYASATYQPTLSVEYMYSSQKNDKIHNTPEFIFQLITEKELNFAKGLWLNLHLNYRSNQPAPYGNLMVIKDDEPYLDEDFVIKGYLLANLGLRYTFKQFSAEVSCYNLLNHKYLLGGDRVPVPQAGRMFLGTLHVKL